MKSKTTFSINQSSMAFLIGMLLCISSVSITVSAQNMQDTIIAHFNLLEKVPQEKLYLHLDKPFYGAGEKIWFKGYLVNAVTHQDNTQSNFIITELVNRSDSIIERRKIRIMPSHFLPRSLQAIITCEDTVIGCLTKNRNSFILTI